MVLQRSIHRPFPSPDLPDNSRYINSDNPLTPRESPMIDSGPQTIMPALLVNAAPTISDHNHDALHHFPRRAYDDTESSYAWPRSEQPETFSHTPFDCRVEPNSSAIHSQICFGDVEDHAQKESKWDMGFYQQLPTPFPSSSSSFNNSSFELDRELSPSAQLSPASRSSIPLTSNHFSQISPWTDFTAADNLEIARARPRYNSQQTYAFDTVPSLKPSPYETSSDLRTPTQPRIHRHSRETERLDSLHSESESDDKHSEPPYAKLIYRALMEAPKHQMVLREIYEWISKNTDKARDPAFMGWQNSVRHNLSMNGAFRKVPHVDPSNKAKKGFIWVLEPSAVGVGIESTTRYRQKTSSKRSENLDLADPKRQRSGRKGGRATRKSIKLRKSALRERNATHRPYFKSELGMAFNVLPHESFRQVSPLQNWNGANGLPYYLTPPLSSTQSTFPETDIYDDEAVKGNPETQLGGLVLDRQGQLFFGHSVDSGCASTQHERSDTIKFEDHYLPSRFSALS